MNNPLQIWQQRVEGTLQKVLPSESAVPTRLHQAMRYSIFNGGKRVRPALLYATGRMFGVEAEILDSAAAAIEIIHSYSLIHDDLPSMDDDDIRRGRATCHREFDEATAILAGDALQSLAFEVLVNANASLELRLDWIKLLSNASGSSGMVGGQQLDLAAEQVKVDSIELNNIHNLKTGALIKASILMGASAAESCKAEEHSKLTSFAEAIGLAFQVQDDILDIEGESSKIGKPQGSDLKKGKSTFVSLYGMDGAKAELHKLQQQALDSLTSFDQRSVELNAIIDFITKRDH